MAAKKTGARNGASGRKKAGDKPADSSLGDEKRGPGQPTRFKAAYVEQARKLCELGATDQEIAAFFDVHKATLYRWRAAHPELVEAMAVGKEVADERVVQSLYHKAVGYTFEAEKIVVDAKTGKTTRVKHLEHVAPDTTACIFWLKNRRPDEWRDVKDHRVEGEVTHRHDLTDSELEEIAAAARKSEGAAPTTH